RNPILSVLIATQRNWLLRKRHSSPKIPRIWAPVQSFLVVRSSSPRRLVSRRHRTARARVGSAGITLWRHHDGVHRREGRTAIDLVAAGFQPPDDIRRGRPVVHNTRPR